MLRYLRIRDLAVLAEAEIRFGPGLNLLTGETGAGKSIVVDALGLILGDRASSSLVRAGAPRLVVEAVFHLGQEAALEELVRAGIDVNTVEPGEVELVVRREVSAEGSRAFVNGSPATVGTLRRVGNHLMDIHGQHEHLSLLDPRQQMEALDDFAGLGALRREVRDAHEILIRCVERLKRSRNDRSGIEERMEVLRFRLQAFDAVDPQPEEDEALRRERDRLAHSARITELASACSRILDDDDADGILGRINRMEVHLGELAGYVPELESTRADLVGARLNLEEISLVLRDRNLGIPEDPERLEWVDARLSALADLSRRFGGSLTVALEARREARDELEDLEAAAGDPEAVAREVEHAAATFADAASRLSACRTKAAARLRRRLASELKSLAMEGTSVEVRVEVRDDPESPVRVGGRNVGFDARGIDRVEFWIAANPGEEALPLAKAASGGELSRMMLALECARLQGKERVARRLVFDEIDAGIGGRVAAAVGERLHRISRDRQVLCVTHLPQIASRADRHLVVEKSVDGGRTVTRVRTLDSRGKVAEVARMLGGARITDATRRHAREMIGGPTAGGGEA